MQPENLDPTELNDGMMALVRAARQCVKPELTKASEELEVTVFDPLLEENRDHES